MLLKPYSIDKILMGKLPYGSDLLEGLSLICDKEKISVGKIEGIGAVQSAVIGYYDQNFKEYRWTTIDKKMEVLALVGNISIKDNKPFVHAHITLADEHHKIYGGHLSKGTIVFAFEYTITILKGDDLIREFDKQTGLFLWNI